MLEQNIAHFGYLVIGIAVLVWSADRFTDGAAAIARNFGVSPLTVGMTIVAIGSSAPEIFVSATASLSNTPDLAIGNAIGSNITNIALVLGVTALVRPLKVESTMLKREFPVLFICTFIAGLVLMDSALEQLEGIILLLCLIIYVAWLVTTSRSNRTKDPIFEEIIEELPEKTSNKRAMIWIAVGMILLPSSSHLLVHGATGIAHSFGISELVIGLTIVAIGTSLPELAASIAGVLKGEHEMAIGNVIGSNIFNLLAVLGLPALLAPNRFSSHLMNNYFLMAALTIAMFVMAYGFKGPGRINRFEGLLLLSSFVAYIYFHI